MYLPAMVCTFSSMEVHQSKHYPHSVNRSVVWLGHGLVVTAKGSRLRGPGFESCHYILDGCHDFEPGVIHQTLNRIFFKQMVISHGESLGGAVNAEDS